MQAEKAKKAAELERQQRIEAEATTEGVAVQWDVAAFDPPQPSKAKLDIWSLPDVQGPSPVVLWLHGP